jgi:hypothetical protein
VLLLTLLVPPESQAAAPEFEHDGRQQSQNRDAQPAVPDAVAVHIAPEDDPDDDAPELPVPELEPLEEPLELVDDPLDEPDPDPLLEPLLLPLLLPLPLLECPESAWPPSDPPELLPTPPELPPEPPSLGPPSSPGACESVVPHAEATAVPNPITHTI